MKGKYNQIILWGLFVFILVFRLYFAFSQPNFTPDAYFHLRQIDHIEKTGLPLINDDLSYGGRTFLFMPGFHFILSFFATYFPLEVAGKLFPNIFASCLVFIVYFISKHITKDSNASLFAAFISSFIPIYIKETISSVSVFSLQIPLIFLFLYSFMRSNNRRFVTLFAILAFVLTLIDLSVIVLIVTFLIFLILIKLENLKFYAQSIELTLFFTFISLWIILVVFKKAFAEYGPSIVYRNIPAPILMNYFSETSLATAIAGIGIIPLIVGCYITYRHFFKEKNKDIFLMASFIVTITILLWLKLVQPLVGLSLLGVAFAILFGPFYKLFFDYVAKTKLARYKYIFLIILLVIFFFNSIIPSIVFAATTNTVSEEAEVMEWVEKNTPEGSIILAPYYLGHLIAYKGKRGNVMDDQFLLVPLPEQRWRDINAIYKTFSLIDAVTIMENYKANYLYLPRGVDPQYITDETCFDLKYNKEIKVYERTCKPVVRKTIR